MLHYYTAYRLTFCSAIELPELRRTEQQSADVVIAREHVDWLPDEVDIERASFRFGPAEMYLHWRSVGTFVVRNGREIVVDAVRGVPEDLLRLPLLGIVLAVLLHQRGHLVLHASAVALDNHVAVFMGEKGQGKSTMAAALRAKGHQLMADDAVVVDIEVGQPPMVRPGFPLIKLWPDAAKSLGSDPMLLPRLAEGLEKRAQHVESQSDEALPLCSLFLLHIGRDVCLTPLDPRAALIALIGQTYVALRFGKHLLRGDAAANHLRQCTELIRTTPMFVLERPSGLHLLPDVVRLVEEHMHGRSRDGRIDQRIAHSSQC